MDTIVEKKIVRLFPGETVFTFDGRYDQLVSARRIFVPKVAGASCLIVNWEASGVFAPVTSSPTGKYFELNIADLTAIATGSITASIDLPDTPGYGFRFALKMDTTDFGGQWAGSIDVYLNNSLLSSQIIEDTSVSYPDYPERYFVAGFDFADLSAYAGTTVDLEFRYNPAEYALPTPGTGTITIGPVRVCKVPKGDPFGSQLVASTSGMQTNSRTFDLVNPDTGEAEFFCLTFSENGNTSNGLSRVKVNGATVFEYSIPNDFFVYPLPEELAGTTVEVTVETELTPTIGEGREIRLEVAYF
jgi:hypothetical protein